MPFLLVAGGFLFSRSPCSIQLRFRSQSFVAVGPFRRSSRYLAPFAPPNFGEAAHVPPTAVAASLVVSLTLASCGTSPSATASRASPSPPPSFVSPGVPLPSVLVVVLAVGR